MSEEKECPVLRNGSSGDDVKALQEKLNANGASLEVDGVYGPATESAVRTYQTSHDLAVDGIAGPNTLGSLNTTSTDAVAGTTTPADPTNPADDPRGSELIAPGESRLWLNSDTGEYWIVYTVPPVTLEDGTTSRETYYSWRLESDADLEAVVGPDKTADPAFTGSNEDFKNRGVVDLGRFSEVIIMDMEGDPFDTWADDYARVAEYAPWKLDDDWVERAVEIMFEREDGIMRPEDLWGTQWWKDHNPQERLWMETFESDPAAAQQQMDDNRANMKVQLANAGIDNASDELVNWMADRTTMGTWSTTKLTSQVKALSDPSSVDTIDDELFTFLANEDMELDTTRKDEDTVRNLLKTWLGPVYGDWSEEDIATKAGELRNNPDGEIEFVEYLKDQRMATLPNYKDRNISYTAAMQPWKTYTQSQWGVPVDEMDTKFQEIVQLNDPEAASQIVRSAGLERGYDKTRDEVMDGLKTATRTNVRGAV